ncbi:hypothetical protein CHARACLAT_026660, partial [Characodon lateralis]|nr:hypothetical protein [Characodon lateralis]
MAIGVVFLVVLFGLANSQLPRIRTCDPVQDQDTKQSPTVCSNYKNIEFLYGKHLELESIVLTIKKSAENNNVMLERLEKSLNNALTEFTRSTKNQNAAIQSLRNDVVILQEHQNRVGGTLSDIEQRLDITEGKLIEKKAKLGSLEVKTEAAFNNTKTLLNSYKDQLSHLNSMAQDLEVHFEGRLNITKMELEEKLEATEKNTEDKISTLEMKTEASFNSTKTLLNLYKNQLSHLNSTTQELGVNLDYRLNFTKKELEDQVLTIQLKSEDFLAELTRSINNQKVNITSLKNEVDKLVKHQEIFGRNVSDIEKRVDVTERQLTEEKAKLENLETETEAAFNNTNILLSSYMKELSHLKTTDWDLEVKVEAWLNITKMDLEDKLEAIWENSEAANTKLHNQKNELDHKIESRFNKAIYELKTQNITMNNLIGQTAAKLENLEKETEASFNSTKTLLETYKDELSHLNLTTLRLKVKYENQWDATKTDIEIKLNMIQETTE